MLKKILSYVIPTLICGAIAVAILAAKGSFVKTGQALMGDLSDAFFVPGVVTAGVGALIFATNGGAFDMLAFGVKKLFDLFKRDMTKVKYRTFYDYRQAQKEKKRSFASLLIVGLAFVAAAAVFLILYTQNK